MIGHSVITAWLNQASGFSFALTAVVVLAGLLVRVAPSSLPLYSVVGGYIGGRASGRAKGLLLSAGFVLGQASVDAGIGVLFGVLGEVVLLAIAHHLALTFLLIAVILTVLGLALLRKIYIAIPVLHPRARHVESFWAACALGLPFGLSTCPACTPLVLPVLGAAAASGSPWLGGLVMFLFGVARGAPLLLIGAAVQEFKQIPRLMPWVPMIERAGGILLLLAAVFFLYQSITYADLVPGLLPLLAT